MTSQSAQRLYDIFFNFHQKYHVNRCIFIPLQAIPSMQSEQLTILYAEDDFDEFDFFREALLRYDRNARLYHARNGVHALESLTTYVPDIIFLDINMPLMDGWECLDAIKKTPRLDDVPVFMISTTRDVVSHQK